MIFPSRVYIDLYCAISEHACDYIGGYQFTCGNYEKRLRCIPTSKICDGIADCEDNSDEPIVCNGELQTGIIYFCLCNFIYARNN